MDEGEEPESSKVGPLTEDQIAFMSSEDLKGALDARDARIKELETKLAKAEEAIEFLLGMVKDYVPPEAYVGIADQPAAVLADLRGEEGKT